MGKPTAKEEERSVGGTSEAGVSRQNSGLLLYSGVECSGQLVHLLQMTETELAAALQATTSDGRSSATGDETVAANAESTEE